MDVECSTCLTRRPKRQIGSMCEENCVRCFDQLFHDCSLTSFIRDVFAPSEAIHSREMNWFLARESPTSIIVLFLILFRNSSGSNLVEECQHSGRGCDKEYSEGPSSQENEQRNKGENRNISKFNFYISYNNNNDKKTKKDKKLRKAEGVTYEQ